MDWFYRDSLQRRLSVVHSLYREACSSMTAEQVNAVIFDGVLPIAFSLVHQILIEDGSAVFAGGPEPLFNPLWANRMKLAIPDHGKEMTVTEMIRQRIGNFSEFCEFQSAVFAKTEQWIGEIDPNSLDDIVVPQPYGPTLQNTFSARLGSDRGITRSDAIESWIYQHALRHLGEIEHGRALVGLGGLTS
jgi:hypothetical protein